jgi:2-dehydropantoate 2-reductase
MWRKLCLNCIVNPITALRDIPNGDLLAQLDSPAVQQSVRELSQVLYMCAPREAHMQPLEILEELVALLSVTAGNSSSMREDIRQGRETEIRQLNLAVADAGEASGVPCSTLRELGERVLNLEAKKSHGDESDVA